MLPASAERFLLWWISLATRAGDVSLKGPAKTRCWVPQWQLPTFAGTRGPNSRRPSSIAACAKHYVGYGAAEAGRDYDTVDMSEGRLREVYFPPFKAAVDAGAATFMSSFNTLNGVPATANRFTLRQVLKGEWGFRGLW